MADSLTFSVGADTRGLSDSFDGLIGKVAALAAAFLGAQSIIEAFGNAIDLGGRLHDLSTRTGETAGNLAILERAFDNTSVGAEKLGPAISKMQVNITALATDSEAAKNAFTQLGLTFADLQGKSPTEQLQIIGTRLAAIQDDGLRAATAVALFGRNGAELLPVLTNFSKETAEASRQLGSLPSVLDATAANVDSLGDNLAAIKNKGTELAYGFLSEVVPAVEKFTNKLAGADAASIGAGLAQALVGAFVNPMKAAELLVEILQLGAAKMGNTMANAAYNFGFDLGETFTALGTKVGPLLASAIGGGLDAAAQKFVSLMLGGIANAFTAFSNIPGLDHLANVAGNLRAESQKWSEGAGASFASAKEAVKEIQDTFKDVSSKSSNVELDFYNAKGSVQDIKDKFASLQGDAKAAMNEFSGLGLGSAPPTLGEGDHLTAKQRAELDGADKVKQHNVMSGGGGGGGKTQAQQDAIVKQQLALLSGLSPNQLIGSSASAQKAMDLIKDIEVATLKGKSTDSMYKSLQRNLDIAFGAALTPGEVDAATQWARKNLNNPNMGDLSFTQLEKLAQDNMLQRNRQDAGIDDFLKDQQTKQQEKASTAGAGGKAGGGGSASPMATLEKIAGDIRDYLKNTLDPKVPQQVMT